MPRLVFIQFHVPLDANGVPVIPQQQQQQGSGEASNSHTHQQQQEGVQGQQQHGIPLGNISANDFLRLFAGFVPLSAGGPNGEIPEQLLRDIMNGRFGHHGPPKPPAMDKQAREELPTFTYNEDRAAYMRKHATEGCTVCLSDFEEGEKLTALPCGHYFHSECIAPWIDEKNTCPTCRYEMRVTDPELEAKRLKTMEERFGKEMLQIIEKSSDIERYFSIVYDMKHRQKPATIGELNKIDVSLEKIIDYLDSLQVDEDARVKRREQIVKIQHTQKMLGEVRDRCREEENLDSLLESTLSEFKQEKPVSTSSSQKRASGLRVNTGLGLNTPPSADAVNGTKSPAVAASFNTSSPLPASQPSTSFTSPLPDTPLTATPNLSFLFSEDSMNAEDAFPQREDSASHQKKRDVPDSASSEQPPRKKRRLEATVDEDLNEEVPPSNEEIEA